MNTLSNIILFVVVMLLTVGFVYKATAAEPVQDLDAIDYEARAYCKVHACKPNEEQINNPFQH